MDKSATVLTFTTLKNMLVGVTTGSSILFSIDAFNGYNSIKMDPLDAEKTAFRTILDICIT